MSGSGGGGYGAGGAAAAVSISLVNNHSNRRERDAHLVGDECHGVHGERRLERSGAGDRVEDRITGCRRHVYLYPDVHRRGRRCLGDQVNDAHRRRRCCGHRAVYLHDLVADTGGTAALTADPNLVNPWGIAFAPNAPVWIANNGTSTSTLYDGSGNPQPAASPLIVKLTASAGHAFAPTGIVANTTPDFVLSAGGVSGAASFIYVGEDGTVAGWSSAVNPTLAVTTYTDTEVRSTRAPRWARPAGSNYLYAADFHNNKIDVFNSTFTKQAPSAQSFAFADPGLPAGYAPFGIQAIPNGPSGATQIYVAYAQQNSPDNSFGNIGQASVSWTFSMRTACCSRT